MTNVKFFVYLILLFLGYNSFLYSKSYQLYSTSEGVNNYKLSKNNMGTEVIFKVKTANCFEIAINEAVILDYDENGIDSKIIFKNNTCNITSLVNLQETNVSKSKNNEIKTYNLFANSKGPNTYLLSKDEFGNHGVFTIKTLNCYEVVIHGTVIFKYDADNINSELIFNNKQKCIVKDTIKN
jgi:hypothetical protein